MDNSYNYELAIQNELFQNSIIKKEYGEITQIDINLEKFLISEIKVGVLGDQIKISFYNHNGSRTFCPKNWVYKLKDSNSRFSEDMIYNFCNYTIYYLISYFFDDFNRMQEQNNCYPRIYCSESKIRRYVDRLAYSILDKMEKQKIPYDFSFR